MTPLEAASEAKQAAYAAHRRAVTGPQLAAYDKGVTERPALDAAKPATAAA